MYRFFLTVFLCACIGGLEADTVCTYRMQRDRQAETIDMIVRTTDEGYTINTVQAGEERLTTVDAAYAARTFSFRKEDIGTDYTAVRAGKKIIVTGRFKGRVINRDFSINDNPWFQSIEQSLEYFAAHPENHVTFWFVNADDCEIMEMEATKEARETITVRETTFLAQRVKVNVTGFASLFWRADYWFRLTDNRYLRYETVEGLGGPLLVIELAGEQVNR